MCYFKINELHYSEQYPKFVPICIHVDKALINLLFPYRLYTLGIELRKKLYKC